MMTAHPQGHYHFVPAGRPYSSGAVADAGYEVVHAVLGAPLPWREGFERLRAHLASEDAGPSTLCGVELRCPSPHSVAGFDAFNEGYRALLGAWGVLVGDVNPVARTNVAPEGVALADTALFGFSYVVPAKGPAGRTFVVAGAGEVRGVSISESTIVRFGDTTEGALLEKAAYVVSVMEKRMAGLGVGWGDATAVDVYTAHDAERLMRETVLPRLGAALMKGVHRFHARPPVAGIEYEMDVRGVRRDVMVA